MPDGTFDVTRFENRNGVTSWRVFGWLHGLRVRRNFKSREEAGAEMAVLEAKAAQAGRNVRATSTFLTNDQLREAESAFRRLIGAPESLSFYLDYALTNYRAAERAVTCVPALPPELGVPSTASRSDVRSHRQTAFSTFKWTPPTHRSIPFKAT